MKTTRLELQVKRHEAPASPRLINNMKCPLCHETDLVMTERQGVEMDYCHKCHGVWLDRGELDRIIESMALGPALASMVRPVASTQQDYGGCQ